MGLHESSCVFWGLCGVLGSSSVNFFPRPADVCRSHLLLLFLAFFCGLVSNEPFPPVANHPLLPRLRLSIVGHGARQGNSVSS